MVVTLFWNAYPMVLSTPSSICNIDRRSLSVLTQFERGAGEANILRLTRCCFPLACVLYSSSVSLHISVPLYLNTAIESCADSRAQAQKQVPEDQSQGIGMVEVLCCYVPLQPMLEICTPFSQAIWPSMDPMESPVRACKG
jgi:hypothetical protein